MLNEARIAGDHIRNGRVILYPTDTIWGIGCDATDTNAVQRIYEIKQRSDRKSMLVLMGGISMLSNYLDQIPEKALEILNSSSKPTTIVYPGARNLAKNLVADDNSIGVRITLDPFCMQLIEETGIPIVSTSANLTGDSAPLLFKDIGAKIMDSVDYVVNWRQEETTASTPSTILRIDNSGEVIVLRP